MKDHQRRGQVANKVDCWDIQVCKDSTDYMDMEDSAENNTKIKPPEKLKDGDWVQWQPKLLNYLSNHVGDKWSPSLLCHQKGCPSWSPAC